jgi:hypothetical protein
MMNEEFVTKTGRFIEPQIVAALRQVEGGWAIPEPCRLLPHHPTQAR